MKKFFIAIIIICSFCLGSCGNDEDKNPYVIDESFERKEMVADEIIDCDEPTKNDFYDIVWSDEFNYTGAPDSSKWTYELGIGDWGWGNNEKQYYTNRLDNSKVENGNLIITAKKEQFSGSDYTSARLVSRNKGDFKYGYIEMRAKLAGGGGVWPAFWMMPTDSVYGGWPASGEIDIMEYVGNRPNYILGTCHSQRYNGGNGRGTTIYRPNVENEYHNYGIEWSEDSIKWLFDGEVYHTWSNPKYSTNNYQAYPYDQDFFVILNIAMGGNLGGSISPTFTESSMYVDYVRVYQLNLEGIDKEKPNKTTITSYATSSTNISIEWDKVTDDYGVKQYEIVVNGKQVLATTKNYCTITNLNPKTEYTIQIIALDKGKNFSVSAPLVVKTTDVLKAPGIIEVEQYAYGSNVQVIQNAADGRSVDISNIDNANGYIICEVTASETAEYKITANVMVPRGGSSLFIYVVDQDYLGAKSEEIGLKSTYGNYTEIEVSFTIALKTGINYLKIEGYNASEGKIVTIDNLKLKKA